MSKSPFLFQYLFKRPLSLGVDQPEFHKFMVGSRREEHQVPATTGTAVMAHIEMKSVRHLLAIQSDFYVSMTNRTGQLYGETVHGNA
jgi:hypothetical protein